NQAKLVYSDKVNCMNNLKKVGAVASLSAGALVFFMDFPYTLLKDYSSGVLGNGGQILVGFGGKIAFSSDTKNYVFFAVPPYVDKNKKIVVPMRLSVTNSYNATDVKVVMSIRYGKENYRSYFPENIMKNKGYRLDDEIKFELSKTADFDFAKYRITSLDENDVFSTTEVAFAKNKEWGDQIPLLFQNSLSIETTIVTNSEKDKRRDWLVSYNGVNVDNSSQMLQWVHDFYGKKMAIEIRKEHNLFSYLYNIILGNEVKVFGFYPQFELLPNEDIYMPKNMKESVYHAFVFKPYSWDLLFE
ncbi:TPA: hypothetical protein ACVO14_004890, partial [Vibrio alginolyticus]